VTTTTTAVPLFDWHTLGQSTMTSAVISIGVVVLFSIAVYSLSIFRRSDTTVAVRSMSAIVMSTISLVIVATLVWGFYIIVTK
jgi:hypothetical protein